MIFFYYFFWCVSSFNLFDDTRVKNSFFSPVLESISTEVLTAGMEVLHQGAEDSHGDVEEGACLCTAREGGKAEYPPQEHLQGVVLMPQSTRESQAVPVF